MKKIKELLNSFFLKVKNQIKLMTPMQLASIIVPCVIFLILFITAYTLWREPLLELVTEPEKFKMWLDSLNGKGEIVFVSIRAFQTVIKIIPAEPLEVASGYAFGTWGGLLWCIVGTEIGSAVIIILTKLFGVKFVEKFVSLDKINSFSFLTDGRKRKLLLFIIYLIPGTPKDILTYFAGLTNINLVEFIVITAIARIPSIITSTMCGESLGKKDYLGAFLIYAATVALSAAGVWVYKKIVDKENKHKKINC